MYGQAETIASRLLFYRNAAGLAVCIISVLYFGGAVCGPAGASGRGAGRCGGGALRKLK
jgi:hypothetical protein